MILVLRVGLLRYLGKTGISEAMFVEVVESGKRSYRDDCNGFRSGNDGVYVV